MDAIIVGGWKDLTPRQKRVLELAGIRIVGRVPSSVDPIKLVETIKDKVDAIVATGMPPHKFILLIYVATKNGLKVFNFKVDTIIVKTREEAEKLAIEKNADGIYPTSSGAWKVVKTLGLKELKRIFIAEEVVVELP